ncbi:hypothetical protein QBC35DRAFT_530961 [Podospora australis]|uniref:F-box domain-containing protein n=1 Tax=Podospora australis TaxID=1536484 RepID=A0AAN7AKX7_9PEZI|nr:hypothetical protein QBC35DRAFT_530961 [Podospora australis]
MKDIVNEHDFLLESWRSFTPYALTDSPKEHDEILTAAAYARFPREDVSTAFITLDEKTNPTLGDVRAALEWTSPEVVPATGLGNLAVLPFEITHKILDKMDIATFMAFRSLDRTSRTLASRRRDYRLVVKYVPNLLVAVLKTQIAPHRFLSALIQVLRTQKCRVCGTPSGVVFLPHMERVCTQCLYKNGILVISGQYNTLNDLAIYRPSGLTSRFSAAQRLWISGSGHLEEDCRPPGRRHAFMLTPAASMVVPFVNIKDRTAIEELPRALPAKFQELGAIWCAGCFHQTVEITRHNSSFFTSAVYNTYRRAYSVDEFSGHFRHCRQTQEFLEMYRKGRLVRDEDDVID